MGRLFAAVPGAFLLQPTTCTEIIFISTLVTFSAPGTAVSWQVGHTILAACFTIATLGFVPITFLELEGFYLIDGGHLSHSSIRLVSVEVLDGCLMLLGMFQ